MKNTSEALEQLFQALSDRTRVRLLNLMAEGEVCVCFFVEVLGDPQPKISRHLAYLRSAGLVATRREAKWMHYRITPPEHPAARNAFNAVLQTFDDDRELQRDRVLLAKACCAPRMTDQLKRAPRPTMASSAMR
ncbi:MAG TPA: metalloregulator ArsR/SmtB family transcription factor [Thermoanaerobaculia bacterium]|jgi:ArsR family transcriptional regulator|nr:metalloregulator ArsR/SmtB family transcription factor [Thermoanaerobaculia bacterium]